MTTLYCPECGYNLTGLPANRCPECGNAFDPESIRSAPHEPISLAVLLIRLLWAPFLFNLGLVLVRVSDQFIVLVFLSGFIILSYGILNAHQLASRLAEAHRMTHTHKQRRRFVGLVASGFYCCQVAIAFGGCVACVSMSL